MSTNANAKPVAVATMVGLATQWPGLVHGPTGRLQAPSGTPAASYIASVWRLHVLSSLRTPALDELVAGLGLDTTRRALLAAFRPLAGLLRACAALTVLLGRVLPGLRVM
jgi:hypothetical protein